MSLWCEITSRETGMPPRRQCESIQGRAPGMDLDPFECVRDRLLILGPVGFMPVVEARLGLSDARSLMA